MASLTLKSYLEQVEAGTLNPADVVKNYLDKATNDSDNLHAFVRLHPDYVEKNLNNFKDLPLHWAPIGIKDNIMTQGHISSCGSKMLENYIAPYSATCFEKLEKSGGLMIGKTNMDEFAMGGSTETSYFKKTKNPWNYKRVLQLFLL